MDYLKKHLLSPQFGMRQSVASHRLGDDENLLAAIVFLVTNAISGGVNHEGESCTFVVPNFSAPIGDNDDPVPLGEWEIKITKINGSVGDEQ